MPRSYILALPIAVFSFTCCAGPSRLSTPGAITPDNLQERISRFSRVETAHLPTPLDETSTLSGELAGPKLFIKRDDQTGLAFGGNKARKLDFIIADALDKRADVILTWASVQSNWCRQTAAAARMFGLQPILVLSKRDEGPVEYAGNLLLDEILGADVRFVEPGQERGPIVDRIVEEEERSGRMVYSVPVGGSSVGGSMTQPLGAISYVEAFVEIFLQSQQKGIDPDYIVIATGSGGTQAGLVVGARALGSDATIVGISVSGRSEAIQRNVAAIANQTSEVLGLDLAFEPDEITVFDQYVGEGYGILNEEIASTIAHVARQEGILLDPVYTGKAMTGLFDLCRRNYFQQGDTVIFIHTGGTPALFVYQEQLLEYIK